ncbi:MAG: hypothetical protein HOC20_10200 [Chloroflexi bacterium]|jgi:hypothetical protein|nr:hypothetical protein [Chloroflexota bacterium]
MGLEAEAIAEFEESIQEAVDPEPVEPYLGTYTNPVLGEITAEWKGDQLIFDAGEFQAEIRSVLTDEGEVSYFLYDSVLKGLGIEPEEDTEGNLTVTIGASANEYLFTKVE